ncbi:MAG: IscS subfamily cysteine desulfurase, partial [Nitrosopumilus sp.]
GMICRRGAHAPEIIYSKDRLLYPQKRVGPKGSFKFERITWDEAYETIADRLNQIKDEFGPEATSIYTGRGAFELSLCDIFQPKGVEVSSASSVLFPFGSPNTMGVGALCYVSFAMIAPHVTMGRMLVNMFTDIENADLLVVWGSNPATDSPPLDMNRLEQAKHRGAEIVVIDPRRTDTAISCDAEWIPIRPGTDGALALGMINVMIEEELYDENFAKNWTLGFDDLAQYVQHFRPEIVEGITGVPKDTITDLARRICKATGAAPIMYTGLEYSNSGVQAIRAVMTFWALAGHLDSPGGLCLAMLNSQFPINRSGNVASPDKPSAGRDRFPVYTHYRGECHATGLIDAVLDERPYPIKALIIHGASILTSWPETPKWRKTLAKLDFVVCIDRQLTADAAYADILLPATTMFEIESYMSYGPLFRIREKIIEPLGEARNDYLIMAELAKRLGYGHLYPQTEEELLQHVLKGSDFTLDQVRKNGGIAKIKSPMMEYRKWEKGGLRQDGKPGFDTPSGKFEIASNVLLDYGYEPLPKYTEPVEGPIASPQVTKKFPLVFNSGSRPHTDFRSQHHGIKGLLKDHPEPSLEMNQTDAEARKILDGDLVELRTLRGSAQFRAQVTDRIVSGAIDANMGGGGPVGPIAWQNCNVNELTDLENHDVISGFPVYKALLCEVVKVGDGTSSPSPAAAVTSSQPILQIQKPRKKIGRVVYLDNNATTKVAPEVREAMIPYLSDEHGNPSGLYSKGRIAREAIDNARRQVANLINTKPRRITFTGSGTEADNLALKGIAFAFRKKGTHIITTKVEHPAVLNSCHFLEEQGFRVTYLGVDQHGLLDPLELKKAMTKDTILVSVMMANNEVGTIQPIKELAQIAHDGGSFFHTDAVQAAGKIPIDVEDLDVDLLTLSGHKFYGPKGVGVLFVKRGIELEPLVHGGKQESGLRSGTENVSGIVGMGVSAELAISILRDMANVEALRDRLEAGIMKHVPEARVNGHPDKRLPNTLNMTLPNLRGESLVLAMDQKGIALSSGSACKSGSPEPSHALLAMGMRNEDAHCAIRISLSQKTTIKEVDRTLTAFRDILDEMEATVRFLPCK